MAEAAAISLAEVRGALGSYTPNLLETEGRRQAAVAMVLHEQQDALQVLLIERATFGGDPWSGHMAFPGGGVEALDSDPRAAAERETLEEVGVSLMHAEPLGRLDDVQGRHSSRTLPLVISAFVYLLPETEPLRPNYEVSQAFWFPLAGLREEERRVEYSVKDGMDFPGILVGEPDRHIVWGLTYRLVENFFAILGSPLPNRWGGLAAFWKDR